MASVSSDVCCHCRWAPLRLPCSRMRVLVCRAWPIAEHQRGIDTNTRTQTHSHISAECAGSSARTSLNGVSCRITRDCHLAHRNRNGSRRRRIASLARSPPPPAAVHDTRICRDICLCAAAAALERVCINGKSSA